jgi:predicted nucleic-acid-binding protein
MLGLDTNVVMRLLVMDDAEQTRRARKLIEQSLDREESALSKQQPQPSDDPAV